MLTILLVLLAIATVAYLVVLLQAARAQHALRPRVEAVSVGAVVNFFDTLGIGSFAPTLAWLKFRTKMPARLIPCTMIVACTLPTMFQAGIFLPLLGVHVDPVLLVSYAVALLAGGLAGARLVIRLRIWIVQAVVAAALLIAAVLYALSNLHMMPAGGVAAGLPPALTILAVAASFGMGVLLNFGVGHYAPSLVMLSLMGMDPRLVFPIMATAGALAAAVISWRHIRAGVADLRIVMGFVLGGAPAVLVAALVVKQLPVELLRWLVIVVVLYAAATMLRDALGSLRRGGDPPEDVALARAEGLVD